MCREGADRTRPPAAPARADRRRPGPPSRATDRGPGRLAGMSAGSCAGRCRGDGDAPPAAGARAGSAPRRRRWRPSLVSTPVRDPDSGDVHRGRDGARDRRVAVRRGERGDRGRRGHRVRGAAGRRPAGAAGITIHVGVGFAPPWTASIPSSPAAHWPLWGSRRPGSPRGGSPCPPRCRRIPSADQRRGRALVATRSQVRGHELPSTRMFVRAAPVCRLALIRPPSSGSRSPRSSRPRPARAEPAIRRRRTDWAPFPLRWTRPGRGPDG